MIDDKGNDWPGTLSSCRHVNTEVKQHLKSLNLEFQTGGSADLPWLLASIRYRYRYSDTIDLPMFQRSEQNGL